MLQEIKWRRMANILIKVVHECDPAMKQSIRGYRSALTDPQANSTGELKRAARLPYRVEARVQALVTKHGKAKINKALALVSTLTLSDLQAELAPLKVYSDTLKDHYQNDGWTLDQIADDIELNRADIDKDEIVPIPVGYEDDL